MIDGKAKHSPTNDWDTNAVWVDAGRAMTVTQERHTEPQDKTLSQRHPARHLARDGPPWPCRPSQTACRACTECREHAGPTDIPHTRRPRARPPRPAGRKGSDSLGRIKDCGETVGSRYTKCACALTDHRSLCPFFFCQSGVRGACIRILVYLC